MPNRAEGILEDSFSSDAELDEETDESSTDIDAKLEEEDVFDVEFFKCYSALKKKDGKIYDQNVKFFQENDSSSSDNDDKVESKDANSSIEIRKNRPATPKMTLLDHQLQVNEDEIEEPSLDRVKIDLNKEVSKSFYEKELEEIKKSIEKVGEELGSESDDDLLVVKDKGDNKIATRSKDKLKTILDKIEDQEDEDLQHLKSVWSNPENLSDEDRFLRDYILNKRYLANAAEDDDADDEDEKGGYFSKNIDELSDVEGDEDGKLKRQVVAHHSDEKNFDQIARIPRNSTKTIRDIVEKQEKKEKRLKKMEKEKKKKKALKDADCEDIVGDLPTRFHYRETEPNDYGLTAEELLLATDEELEKWISLKDCIAYKSPEEEKALKQRYDSKRYDIDLKKQIFKGIYEYTANVGEQTGDFADQPATIAHSATRKHKKRGKKRKAANSDSESSYKESANDSIQNHSAPLLPPLPKAASSVADANTESNRQRKKKRKKRGMKHKKFAKIGVAPDRLLAYGLSKTKLKKSKIL